MKKTKVLAAFVALSSVVCAETLPELEKAFDKAVSSGRPLSAERAFTQLLEKGAKLAPKRYRQAAEVARQLGKFSERNARLAHYLKVEKNWDGEVTRLAYELCFSSRNADAFAMLAAKKPGPRQFFNKGLSLLEEYVKGKRASDFKKAATALLAAYEDGSSRNEVYNHVCDMVFTGVPGFSVNDAREMLEKYPSSNTSHISRLINGRRDHFSPLWRLRYMAGTPSAVLNPQAFDYTLNILAGKGEDREKERAQAAGYLARIRPSVTDGRHPDQAEAYFRLYLGLRTHLKAGAPAQSADIYSLFESLANAKKPLPRDRLSRCAQRMLESSALVREDILKLRSKYADCIIPDYNTPGRILLVEEVTKAKSPKPFEDFLAKLPAGFLYRKADMRYFMLQTLAGVGDVGSVKKVLEQRLSNGGRREEFNPDYVIRSIDALKIPDKQLAAYLSSVYKRYGSHDFWTRMTRFGNLDSFKGEAVKAFLKTVSDKTQPSDRMVAIARRIKSLRHGPHSSAPKEAHELFAEACRLYPGRYPSDSSKDNRAFEEILGKYVDLCQHNNQSAPAAVEAILAKIDMKKPSAWSWYFSDHCRLVQNSREKPDIRRKAIIARAVANKRISYANNLVYPPNTDSLPFDRALWNSSIPDIALVLPVNWNATDEKRRFLTPRLAAEIASTALLRYDAIPSHVWWKSWWIRDFLPVAESVLRHNPAGFRNFDFDKAAALYLDGKPGNDAVAFAYLRFCATAGKGDKYVRRFVQAISGRPSYEKANILISLCREERLSGIRKGSSSEGFGWLVKNNLVPALRSVSGTYAPLVNLGEDNTVYRRTVDWLKDADKAEKPLLDAYCSENVRLLTQGASGFWNENGAYAGPVFVNVYNRLLNASNAVELAKIARQTGRSMRVSHWQYGVGFGAFASLSDRTAAQKLWESLYLLTSSMVDSDRNVLALVARHRAEASKHLPGVYPVSERDPLYPLYVAADELQRNNVERATALLMRNITVFERDAISLPPDFTAWAVDQMRIARGNKNTLLLKARSLASRLLQEESRISAELAAALVLVRAECYRDEQNFEVAKLEYDTIRNNPAYSKTKSGRKAMFRSVDLMIEMGNSTATEPTLEYWLSQPDAEVQAQAHYFLARIAFDRKDYDECRKRLKEVFSIDFTHTDGRFLEGRWKLATGNEVDDTEVMIGSLSDRTVIRPGQQLAISVQDRNLSVAGGGASIPVVITTAPGGDRERIYLYPTPRDPTLFRGFIDVRLGETVVSNLLLEVSGDDVASYNIDKEFLDARGLPVPPPKRLRVVDDARLIVGTGSPRTDDDEEEEGRKKIEDIIGSAELSSYRTPSLRPGNPLYIAVMDKDRSTGGEGSISVKVSTSSGDVLENVQMKEVRPYSGIFRGEIPTSLPPPRAFGSDTAVGFNAGDVISRRRHGGWKSLSDGRKGKWFSVDTMGSHLFSNIVVKMSSPEELRRLRLTGKIGGDQFELAQFPAPSAEGRAGLRRWGGNCRNVRGEHGVRTFFASSSQKPQIVTNITCSGVSSHGGAYASYFKGAFCVGSANELLRFRITPLRSGSVMTRLWLSVMIDGKPFFSGFGPTLANQIISRKLEHGCHLLEVFSVQYQESDAWELSWNPVGSDASVIPAEWFDVAAHPEINEFLADRASIVRVKDGFSVTFRAPTRLRSFTLDFLEHLSPGVSLDRISAVDWDGKAILPVETDFSDAQRNATLEVAPGDTITVGYTDKVTTSGKQRIVSRTIRSSFNDAGVAFYFEHVAVTQEGVRKYCHSAYRFVPGDTLLVGITDRDLDVSDEADKVDVVIESGNGEKKTLTLIEQEGFLGHGGAVTTGNQDMDGIHTGFFLGLLQTRSPDQTNAAVRAAFPCAYDDILRVSYEDRENTRPGVPFIRTATVAATRDAVPSLTLFHARNRKVEDTSPYAQSRLAALRRRAGNDKVERIYRTEILAKAMSQAESSSTSAIPVNVAAPLLVRVNDPSRARHSRSYLVMEAVTSSEIARAEVDGDEPDVKRNKIRLASPIDAYLANVKLLSGAQSQEEALAAGSFNGAIRFSMGEVDPSEIGAVKDGEEDYHPISMPVKGSDKVYLTIKTPSGDTLMERTVCFVSDATIGLVDSSWTAERNAVHVGERFYVKVDDADRDVSDEPDTIELDARTTGGTSRKIILTETLPHSGVFTGSVRPYIFTPSEKIPEVTTGATVSVEELVSEDRIPVKFGEGILVSYADKIVLPGSTASTLSVTGTVYKGADGTIRLFSKRFRSSDDAVLVQFRLAECLFEQAKDFRKLKQMEKSAESIVKGRTILEEALKNNPQSSHVAQGEFLLANLYQELAAEEGVQAKALREEGDDEGAAEADKKSRLLYAEALARFSSILAVWPEGEYAPRSQYHKAYCLEMLKDFKLAGEEYVKMTYMYPESDLVGDATIRLATYYFREEKKYSTAARIYESFARRFPTHDKAARSLFMCGSCYIKEGEVIVQENMERARKEAERKNIEFKPPRGIPLPASEMYTRAVNAFVEMSEKYSAVTTPELRAQGLYWAGDASLRKDDAKSAYLFLKRAVLEYPETEWARRARGLMLQNGKAFKHLD